MNLYISDLHFGHENVLKFDGRPFENIDEMDYTLIELWNGRVSADDDVYIVGDFSYRSKKPFEWYLKQLKGRKHLVIGNHDFKLIRDEDALKYFESVDNIMVIKDGDKQVVLCHYPIVDWYGARHGSWHIYGHVHDNKDEIFEFMRTRERALNAGCMINNYIPASFDELMRNNERFAVH